MLEVKNLVKTYKLTDKSKTKEVVALDNVSITFPETGLVFLLGKSGSGKSTLLNAIGGLDTFDSGEIIIKGKSSKSFSQSDFDSYRNTFIGFIFQEYNVLEEFTVAKNLELAIELQGRDASPEKVQELLQMVEMENLAKRKPNQLSGGQKQRVAIARALIKEPEIIMADEPTGALDSRTGKQVMETLKKLSKTKLVIIVSHDREFAEIYGDRIVELMDGKIIRDVTKKEVQAVKTSSGISVIDNEIIHIKKGQKPSKEDMEIIFKEIMKNSEEGDTIISLSERANAEMKKANAITDDGNKEVFKDTTPEDVDKKVYDPNKFKLIKSRLKFKDSFKMGASGLKHKKAKLVFTILLSFIAFTLFGVIDTLSSFNRPQAVWSTVEKFDNQYVKLLKGKPYGDGRAMGMPWTETDTLLLNEKFPDIQFLNVVNTGRYFGTPWGSGSTNTLSINGLESQGTVLTSAFYSGMMYLPEDKVQTLGVSIEYGRLPNKSKEVAITKHMYNALKANNAEKVKEYSDVVGGSYGSIEMYNSKSGNWTKYTIVGIVDDKSDFSKYAEYSTEEINSDYKLQDKIRTEITQSMATMLFISEEDSASFGNAMPNIDIELYKGETYLQGGSQTLSEVNTLSGKFNKNLRQSAERLSDWVYYKNGTFYKNGEIVDLAPNEIIITKNMLSSMNISEDDMKLNINSETPFKLQMKENGSTIKEFTVVGYWTDYTYVPILSSADVEFFNSRYNNSSITYSYTFGQDSGDLNIYYYDLSQAKSVKGYIESNSSNCKWEWFLENDTNITYLRSDKQFVSGNLNIAHNEIVLPEDMLSNIGTEEELKAMIEEGLVVDFKMGDNDNPTNLFSFTVVGLTSYWQSMYVSNNTLEDINKELIGCADYTIAILSDNHSENEKFIKYCEEFNNLNTKYTVQNGATAILDEFGEIINTATKYIVWVGVGFAAFAGLLLMNFIATSISYKKREIGILRALGARSFDVFGIFFNESFIIAFINFVLATVATFVASAIISDVLIKELGIELVLLSTGIRQVVLIFGVSLLVAFLSSLLPVYKIAKKKPIDAINNR